MGQSFEEVLAQLARQRRSKVVIGFEVANAGAESPRIGLNLADGSVADVLAAMCAIDSRYTFSEAFPGVIHVRPVQESSVLQTLLDLPVSPLKLEIRDWPRSMFSRFPEYVPELGKYLMKKSMEWASRTGRRPPGTAGVIMSTLEPPLTISMELENTTVRGALNAVAGYAFKHAVDTASGWRVEFIPDRDAPTGLGGYVKWSAFP